MDVHTYATGTRVAFGSGEHNIITGNGNAEDASETITGADGDEDPAEDGIASAGVFEQSLDEQGRGQFG
jgi:hypothetical protein